MKSFDFGKLDTVILTINAVNETKRWRFGRVVARWSWSKELRYIGPG